ncbi:zinc finger BED domain-containing protein RICESLEEPER 2-like [Salvia splendens]|uniref:zinc finger BED domain-containing protein RICESLEEPER 2-like n=1 Tax=Salvia splendens TaxID=180675 RepID=UPI001C27FD81|nr:zinc finger BED domain-containing protein RICESLEEPER 2-like [Salvia splendens]
MLICKKKLNFGDLSAMFLNHDGKLRVKDNVIDLKTCRDWMIKVSVTHNLPLKWVEYSAIRGFLKYLNPNIRFISRNTHASDVMKLYEYEKEKLKIRLSSVPGMLCLTSDLWTACTNSGYICLTAHFVDEECKLNSKILAFCSMPPPHSAPELAQKISDILMDWKIDRKIFSLTLDTAAANNVMVKLLKTRLQLQNSLLCNGEYFHVRCCAHILNLIVQEGLKVSSDALDKVRASIKYVKASEARMIKFKECARKVDIEFTTSLCLDVPTRWNSTYLMLASGIKYQRAFSMLECDDLAYKHCPTEDEWERGKVMCEFLEPFYDITTLISGSSYPTSNLYFMEVWNIARLLEKNSRSHDEVVKSMSLKMLSKFEKYWEEYSDILSMGAVFDPRMKLKLVEYCYSTLDPLSSEDKVYRLKMKLYILYDEYKKKSDDASLSKVSQPNGSCNSEVGESEFMEGVRRQEVGKLKMNPNVFVAYRSYRGATSEAKSALDVYLEDMTMDENAKLDLLKYWKDHSSNCPQLARMACDVLSIPITTIMEAEVATAGIKVLVEKLIDVLKEEYSQINGLSGDIRKLQKTLEMIEAYLSGAENKSITQHAVKMMRTMARIVSCVIH